MVSKKKKLKKSRKARNLVYATKEAVTMTAPVYVGAGLYHIAQQPELGITIGKYATVPWVIGYTGYQFYKQRKKKKR